MQLQAVEPTVRAPGVVLTHGDLQAVEHDDRAFGLVRKLAPDALEPVQTDVVDSFDRHHRLEHVGGVEIFPEAQAARLEEPPWSRTERVLHRAAYLGAEIALRDENRERDRDGCGHGVLEQDFLPGHPIPVDIRTEQRTNGGIALPERVLVRWVRPREPTTLVKVSDFGPDV